MTDTDEIKGTATFQAVLDADRDDIKYSAENTATTSSRKLSK